MDSPIKKILEVNSSGETFDARPIKVGEKTEKITMRVMSWDYLDRLKFHGFDVDQLLIDCCKARGRNNLGLLLEWWLYYIGEEIFQENDIRLGWNPNHQYYT